MQYETIIETPRVRLILILLIPTPNNITLKFTALASHTRLVIKVQMQYLLQDLNPHQCTLSHDKISKQIHTKLNSTVMLYQKGKRNSSNFSLGRDNTVTVNFGLYIILIVRL